MCYRKDVKARYDTYKEANSLMELYSKAVYNYRIKKQTIEDIDFEDVEFHHSLSGLTMIFTGWEHWINFQDIYAIIDTGHAYNTPSNIKSQYHIHLDEHLSLLRNAPKITEKYEKVILIRLKQLDPTFNITDVYEYVIDFNKYDIVITCDGIEHIFEEKELNILVEEYGPMTIEDIL